MAKNIFNKKMTSHNTIVDNKIKELMKEIGSLESEKDIVCEFTGEYVKSDQMNCLQ